MPVIEFEENEVYFLHTLAGAKRAGRFATCFVFCYQGLLLAPEGEIFVEDWGGRSAIPVDDKNIAFAEKLNARHFRCFRYEEVGPLMSQLQNDIDSGYQMTADLLNSHDFRLSDFHNSVADRLIVWGMTGTKKRAVTKFRDGKISSATVEYDLGEAG